MERTLFWAAGVYDQRLGFIPACQWIGGGGTVLSRGYVDHAAGKALARTEYAMEGTEYKTRVRKSMEMEERIGEMSADKGENTDREGAVGRKESAGHE